jgi:mevalonate kinase
MGAKLSGAGGGDCMFAIVDAETEANVTTALQQYGTLVEVETGSPGVRVETSC